MPWRRLASCGPAFHPSWFALGSTTERPRSKPSCRQPLPHRRRSVAFDCCPRAAKTLPRLARPSRRGRCGNAWQWARARMRAPVSRHSLPETPCVDRVHTCLWACDLTLAAQRFALCALSSCVGHCARSRIDSALISPKLHAQTCRGPNPTCIPKQAHVHVCSCQRRLHVADPLGANTLFGSTST